MVFYRGRTQQEAAMMSSSAEGGGDGQLVASSGEDKVQLDECMVCSDQKREVVALPCGHITTCSGCAERVKKCLICREFIDDKKKVRVINTVLEFKVVFKLYFVFL